MTHGDGRGLTRRRALGVLGAGSAALAVAACTRTTTPPVDPMTKDALGALYRETIAIIATYDQAIAASPALTRLLGPMRDDHRQHAVAIASLVGAPDPHIPAGVNPSGVPAGGTPSPIAPAPTSSVAPVDPATSRATITAAEKTAQLNTVKACNEADSARVAVLASIAASRACHVAALAAVR